MNVIRAESLGMCFGVRDALEVIKSIERPEAVTIHGQLVHNPTVMSGLREAGFVTTGQEADRPLPRTPSVLITAHGISERERARLTAASKNLIDTTCPLVKRVHMAAMKLQSDGFFVIVIGRLGHVEVQGVVEDLERFAIVQTPEEVQRYSHEKLGIICQTTTSPAMFEAVRREVVALNPGREIRFIDTICHPTRDNQEALLALLKRVEAVVVVGGFNSNNTRELMALCQSNHRPALHVASADGLDPGWLRHYETIGLTAGTSTLSATLDEVHARILELTSRKSPAQARSGRPETEKRESAVTALAL